MKELQVKKWKAVNLKGKEIEENTVLLLRMVLNISAEQLPKGIEGFGYMRRYSEIFDNAEKNGKLIIEDSDYKMLKTLVEKNVPVQWGSNSVIVATLDEFLSI